MFESHVETSVDSKSIRESLWHQITGPNTIRSLVPTPSVTVDQTFPPIRMGKAGSFIVWMKTQEKSAFWVKEASQVIYLWEGSDWAAHEDSVKLLRLSCIGVIGYFTRK